MQLPLSALFIILGVLPASGKVSSASSDPPKSSQEMADVGNCGSDVSMESATNFLPITFYVLVVDDP